MKQGAYDIGRKLIYFIVAAFLLAGPLLAIKSYTSKGFFDVQLERERVQDFLFARYVIDCLFSRDQDSIVHFGVIAVSQFTDERLQQCTKEPLAVTLQQPGEVGVRIIATDPSLKQYTSLKTLRQEYVLVDGERSLLTVGGRDAKRTS